MQEKMSDSLDVQLHHHNHQPHTPRAMHAVPNTDGLQAFSLLSVTRVLSSWEAPQPLATAQALLSDFCLHLFHAFHNTSGQFVC
jgi:hypothetical protein